MARHGMELVQGLDRTRTRKAGLTNVSLISKEREEETFQAGVKARTYTRETVGERLGC